MDTLHDYLKQNTASLHVETDELFSQIGFATPLRYAMFLRAQAGAAIPLEAALQPFAPTLEAAGLPLAPRSSLLLQDLARLDARAPDFKSVRIGSFHQALGVVYVMEGSRLGGKMLAREIAKIGLPEEKLPVAFLDAPTASGWWAALMRRMEAIAVENQRWSAILQGAALGFDCFKQSASAELQTMETQ